MKNPGLIFVVSFVSALAAGTAIYFIPPSGHVKPSSEADGRALVLLPGVEAFVAEAGAAEASGDSRIYKIRAALSAFPQTLSPDDVFALARAVDSQSVPAGREALEWGEVYNNA